MNFARPWKALPGAISISVRATPKGGRDAIDGVAVLADGQAVLKIRVRAAPEGGEANQALVRLLARTVGVPPRAVTLLQGASSRHKTFRIAGEPTELAAALERVVTEREEEK